MKTLLCLLLLLLLVGCNAGDKVRKEMIDSSFDISKNLEGRKITKVRFSVNQIDMVTDDGNIISFFGYNVGNNGEVSYCPIGAK
jgi:hypothetical protein